MNTQNEPPKRNTKAFFCFFAIGIGFFILAILAFAEVVTMKSGAPVIATFAGIVNVAASFLFLRTKK